MANKFLLSISLTLAVTLVVVSSQATFKNPILDNNSADPAAIFLNGFYYLTLSTDGEMSMTIYKSPRLTDFRNAESKLIYRCPLGNFNLWASELHVIDGELYIYFTMDGNSNSHKMYVIKAEDPNDPMGNWSEATKLMPDWPERAIDGTIMRHGNGKMYFVFASEVTGVLSLVISEMTDAYTVLPSKTLLRGPTAPWEGGVNEGAYFLYNRNVSYMIFSADSTWGPNYCLGMMSITADKDPMIPSDWWYGDNECVFWKNEEENVYTVGHAAFTTSPDGTETWMTYHGCVNTTHINGFRIARTQKIEWDDETGRPVFPRPAGYDHELPVPSGQL